MSKQDRINEIRLLIGNGKIKLPDMSVPFLDSLRFELDKFPPKPIMGMAIITSEYLPKDIIGLLVGTVCKHCGRPMTMLEYCSKNPRGLSWHEADVAIVREESPDGR